MTRGTHGPDPGPPGPLGSGHAPAHSARPAGEVLPSPVNHKLGITTEDLPDGSVRLSLTTDASLHNELGFVHGGITAFLLDGAMGRAIGLSLAPGETCATVELSIQYLAPAGGRLSAHAEVDKSGRSIAFASAVCSRDDGTLVARAHGTWVLKRR
jgi:uncharacterized protein (TIGR00369 family)